MKRVLLVLASLFSVLLFSCQKEVDYVDYTPPQTDSDSVYLKMLVTVDTSLPAGRDTLYKTVFYYDAQKRFVKMETFFNDDPGVSSIMIFAEEMTHFYQGNSLLPFKTSYGYVNETGAFEEADTTFFIYGNGYVIKDSTRIHREPAAVHRETIINSYTKLVGNGWQVNSILELPGLPAQPYITGRGYIDSAGGNIVQQRDSIFAGNQLAQMVSGVLAFDTKHNPMRNSIGLGIPVPVRLVYPRTVLPALAFSKNNPLTITTTTYEAGGDDEVWSEAYVYQYRNDGYPVSYRVINDGGETSEKTYFIYTDL